MRRLLDQRASGLEKRREVASVLAHYIPFLALLNSYTKGSTRDLIIRYPAKPKVRTAQNA